MADVLLIDGPLRGRVMPLPDSGLIAWADPAAGVPATGAAGYYRVYKYRLCGRAIWLGFAGPAPEGLPGDLFWEFLASDLARALAGQGRPA